MRAQPATTAWVSPEPQEDGSFGADVAFVRDMDGDGVRDLLVGAPGESAAGAPVGSGRAYVVSSADGALLLTLASPNAAEYGGFGRSVASVPDVDGDGVPDVVIGAPREILSATYGRGGRVYVYSGGTGELLHTLVSPHPDPHGGGFGSDVAGVVDADGDGLGDVLVGAPGERIDQTGGGVPGRAYVFSGATGDLHLDLVTPSPGAVGRFGQAVESLGDVNGDGRGDLLVSASGEGSSFAGKVYVYSGRNGFRLAVTSGGSAYRNYGSTLSLMGDADGDGVLDYAVSATGSARVISGATAETLHYLGFSVCGGYNTFCSVVSAGDLDGDGLQDLALRVTGGHTVLRGGTWTPFASLPNGSIRGEVDRTSIGGQRDLIGAFSRDPASELPEGSGYLGLLEPFAVGGEELPEALQQLTLAPNPASQVTRLSVTIAAPDPVRLAVYDALGREVAVLADGPRGAGEYAVELDVSGWAPGVYLVRVATGDGVQTTRLTVAR